MTLTRLPADLPARLRAAGLKVVEIDGWLTRGRPASKGPFHPVGVLWHHTGDANGGKGYAEWLAKVGRSDLPAPLCHLSIGRDGTVYVVAAGRANHAGVARASGSVSGGDGNALYVGVECQNTGSEGWRPAQREAMVTTGVVLAHVLGCTADAERGHKETSVTGKWDPGKFDMNAFRGDIAARLKAGPVVQPPARVDAKTAYSRYRDALIAAGKEYGAYIAKNYPARRRLYTDTEARIASSPDPHRKAAKK